MKRRDESRPETSRERLEILNPLDRPCDFCAQLGLLSIDASELPSMRVMTERETQVLSAMREIKMEVHTIKKRMEQIEEDLGRKPRAKQEEKVEYYDVWDKLWQQGMVEDMHYYAERLNQIRKKWKELDGERRSAAEERMRLMGHTQERDGGIHYA